jgi:hypothetical protein
MTAPLELGATHSHLYPGARGHAAAPLRDGPVALTFADGVRVTGDLWGDRLTLAAHRTAKGTEIPEKSWVIATAPPEPDGRVPFRVVARA